MVGVSDAPGAELAGGLFCSDVPLAPLALTTNNSATCLQKLVGRDFGDADVHRAVRAIMVAPQKQHRARHPGKSARTWCTASTSRHDGAHVAVPGAGVFRGAAEGQPDTSLQSNVLTGVGTAISL